MDIDITPTDGGNGRVVTITISGENMDELPPAIATLLEDLPSTCSELLAALTMVAIILDRKQDAFQAGLREATALKKLLRGEPTGIDDTHCMAVPRAQDDDNAFAGEVRELWEFPTVTNPLGIQRRSGGDRRIFEATCLSANKRNVNREDRRLNVDRRGSSVSAAISNGSCSSCGEHAPHHFPTCPKVRRT